MKYKKYRVKHMYIIYSLLYIIMVGVETNIYACFSIPTPEVTIGICQFDTSYKRGSCVCRCECIFKI